MLARQGGVLRSKQRGQTRASHTPAVCVVVVAVVYDVCFILKLFFFVSLESCCLLTVSVGDSLCDACAHERVNQRASEEYATFALRSQSQIAGV